MNKIVIIPELDEDNLYNLLPMIKGLELYYGSKEEAFEIHLLHSMDLRFQAALLKNRVKFHLFEEEELGPIAGLKLSERLTDLFNLSKTFCFREDTGAIALTKYLKGQERYGVNSLQGKLAFTHFMEFESELSPEEKYVYPLIQMLKVSKDSIRAGIKEDYRDYEVEIENFFKAKEVDPFLLLIFDTIEEESEEYLLLKTLQKDLEKNIYLWVSEHTETSKKLVNESPKVLDISEADTLNFDAYLEKSLGVVTPVRWVSDMANNFGVDSIHFKGKGPGLYEITYEDEGTHQKELPIDGLLDFTYAFFNL